MDPTNVQYIDRLQSSLSKILKKIQSEITHHHGLSLTGPQFHMLSLIARVQSCNVSYLAEELAVKPSAITVMTDRLVQNGYIERRHDEQDRRSVLLSITDRGQEVYEQVRRKSREVLAYYFSFLENEELLVLERITQKLERISNFKESRVGKQ